jgi:uncharacterized protein YbjT (DUF2867 family)
MRTTIIGATGKVGSAVVRRLLDAGQPVRAYVLTGHSPGTVEAFLHDNRKQFLQ